MVGTSSNHDAVVDTSLLFELLVDINPFVLMKVGIDSCGGAIEEDTDPSARVTVTEPVGVIIAAT